MTPTVIITHTETRSLVRRRVFNARNRDTAILVLDRLLSERHSGPITINTSSGGIMSVTAEDKAELIKE